jgi:hypothetical protein
LQIRAAGSVDLIEKKNEKYNIITIIIIVVILSLIKNFKKIIIIKIWAR